jgi:hypothetical protein
VVVTRDGAWNPKNRRSFFHTPLIGIWVFALDAGDFLEDLFQREADLFSEEWMSERFRMCLA